MNTKPGPRKKAPQLLALAGFVSLANAPSAMAEQADANGSVSLVDQANAGVAFNIGTQALSGILLGGAQASALTLQPEAALPQSIASTSGNVTVLSTSLVSVDIKEFSTGASALAGAQPSATLIVLAQFN